MMKRFEEMKLVIAPIVFWLVLGIGCSEASSGQRGAATTGGPAPTTARACEAGARTRVPFRLIDNHIVVAVTVNGTTELNMILDTGLGSPGVILFDHELAARMDLKGTTRVQLGGGGTDRSSRYARVATGGRISVAGVEFTGQSILVLEESGVFGGSYADGIIGATLFGHVVEIDYERCVLNLSKALSGEPSEYGHRFDLRFTAGIPVVAASVEMAAGREVPVELLVDTGANAPLLLFTFSHERLRPAGPMAEGRERVLAEGLTGRMLGTLSRIPRLTLGPFVLDEVVAALPDEATMGGARQLGRHGMLGNEVLQRFTVVFDYPASRMFLKPNGQHARRFEYNTAGLVMHGGKAWYEVEDVLKGSPAEEQGVRAGDRIVAINRRPIQEYRGDEISAIFTRRDTTIEVTIERQSERSRIVLALRRVI